MELFAYQCEKRYCEKLWNPYITVGIVVKLREEFHELHPASHDLFDSGFCTDILWKGCDWFISDEANAIVEIDASIGRTSRV